jgi:hypothetical protein
MNLLEKCSMEQWKLHGLHLNNDISAKILSLLLLLCLALTIFHTLHTAKGQSETRPAILKITPPQLVVGEGDLSLVNVTVENVENLFAWQVKVYFNAAILNITKNQISYGENHVFSNKVFLNITPHVSSDIHGFYVLFATSILQRTSDEQGFSGSGTLCQLNFTGISPGISTLNFSTPLNKETKLLNTDLNFILIEVIDNKKSGSLTLELDQTSLYIYERERGITLSGFLTPKEADAKVVVFYRDLKSQWLQVAEVKTDSDGWYSYNWKPSDSGTYYLATEWYGNEETNPAISRIETVLIIEPTPSATPYLIVVLWVSILFLAAYIVNKERTESD